MEPLSNFIGRNVARKYRSISSLVRSCDVLTLVCSTATLIRSSRPNVAAASRKRKALCDMVCVKNFVIGQRIARPTYMYMNCTCTCRKKADASRLSTGAIMYVVTDMKETN